MRKYSYEKMAKNLVSAVGLAMTGQDEFLHEYPFHRTMVQLNRVQGTPEQLQKLRDLIAMLDPVYVLAIDEQSVRETTFDGLHLGDIPENTAQLKSLVGAA